MSTFTMRLCPLLCLALIGCSKKADEPKTPTTPEAPRVAADSKNMLFSFVDADGTAQTATTAQAVPPAARKDVVVVDLSASPEARQADRYVFVADLSQPDASGRYPVAVISRYGFKADGTAAGGTAASNKEVVLYTTSWCGVCKKAKRLLKSWGVPFVEKDIEASKAAQAELSAKAAKAEMQPRGVPVIDVAGTLLTGLDAEVLVRTLESKGILDPTKASGR